VRTLRVSCDISQGGAVAALARACVQRFGAPDIVVDNAGTAHANRPMLEADAWG